MTDPVGRRGAELEWKYLRQEVLLREAIQTVALLALAVLFGLSMWGVLTGAWTVALPFVGSATCLAGIWAHNDNLELRMSWRLQALERSLGIEWESWVKSDAARMRGPIGSGHQVTTRGAFMGTSLVVLATACCTGAASLDVVGSLVALVVMAVILFPPSATGDASALTS